MRQQLGKLHQEILDSLAELERLTAKPEPPMDRLPAVRLALTRASRARTILLENLYPQLIAKAPESARGAVEALRDEAKEDLISSAQHIGAWNMREITSRWRDYCAASNAMRTAMRRRVQREMDVIYPLL